MPATYEERSRLCVLGLLAVVCVGATIYLLALLPMFLSTGSVLDVVAWFVCQMASLGLYAVCMQSMANKMREINVRVDKVEPLLVSPEA